MRGRRFILLFCVFAFLGAGCVPKISPTPIVPTEVVVPSWKEVSRGVERLEASYGSRATRGRLLIYRFSREGWSWRLAHSTSSASVRDWADRLPDASFIVNGVYFHEDQLPSGAFISGGERVGARAFDDDKSAFIVLAPSPRIIDPASEPDALKDATEAAQTFPFLIKNGAAAVSEDSGKVAERSFIATDRDGRIYLGVALDESLSLYELTELLRKQPVEWDRVVNLDGGPSTGFVARFPGYDEGRNSLTPVPNVIVVSPK
jgi:hypothetical protein